MYTTPCRMCGSGRNQASLCAACTLCTANSLNIQKSLHGILYPTVQPTQSSISSATINTIKNDISIRIVSLRNQMEIFLFRCFFLITDILL